MCEYCGERYFNSDLVDFSDSGKWEARIYRNSDGYYYIDIDFDDYVDYQGSTGSVEISINFCPKCGRNLRGGE